MFLICRPNGQHPLYPGRPHGIRGKPGFGALDLPGTSRGGTAAGILCALPGEYHPAGPDRARRLDRTLPDHPLLGTLPDLRDLGPRPAIHGGSRDGRASGQLFLKRPAFCRKKQNIPLERYRNGVPGGCFSGEFPFEEEGSWDRM